MNDHERMTRLLNRACLCRADHAHRYRLESHLPLYLQRQAISERRGYRPLLVIAVRTNDLVDRQAWTGAEQPTGSALFKEGWIA
jgi:hypothetical protein